MSKCTLEKNAMPSPPSCASVASKVTRSHRCRRTHRRPSGGVLYPRGGSSGVSHVVVRRSNLAHGCADGGDAFGPKGCAATTACRGGGVCLPTIDTQVGFWDAANLHIAWAQYLLAPRSDSGWCLLGELDKYNPASKMRLASVAYNRDSVVVDVSGVTGESVTLYAITPSHKIMAKSVEIDAAGSARTIFSVE